MLISINRALAELKTLDSRIFKAIQGTTYVGISVGKKPILGYKDNAEFEIDVKSKYQSAKDLIARRNTIKSLIVNSNASTKVNIGAAEMTVAEAIERKSSIQYDAQLLNKLKSDYAKALNKHDTENERVKQRLDNLLEQNFGRDSKAKNDDVESISKPFLAQNEARLVDAISIKNEIDKLDAEIDEFITNVDYVLTEQNTLTKIEIPE